MNKHLATIKHPGIVRAILDGKKTCESRLFASTWHPALHAQVGDLIYFKGPNGTVFAVGEILIINRFYNLTPQRIRCIRSLWGSSIHGNVRNNDYWKRKSTAKNCLLFEFKLKQLPLPIGALPYNRYGWVPHIQT